ncbi:hypothetical protein MRX96_046941 [Rhipicephalus microplus]
MVTRVMRSQRADGTTEDQKSDRNEASADMTGTNVIASESTNLGVQVRMKEVEIQRLKLQMKLQKLKLQFQAKVEVERSDRSGLAGYADRLRAVLPPMPVSNELVPAMSWCLQR